ncbi:MULTISPECIES: ABC transporter permease [Mesonia]|uniref:Macrolide export ATP-binding/permease protein MacB n=1 Tax=Mesonia oceanica TaxID=2687242 RepID=A0AC61YB50_9FLAO|nr:MULTISPECIES: ABC transporter permease [Mesonia]MBJ96994.1 cell division protein FtsX [Flavobacteriaceae bacterium]MAN25940.1 cell division protein FtsX [Mesonia sp.]MAN26139.1 cell division protein FtsX [Mesonia sp.]MAQ39507.1 cell division protein FtsX [Mesonia sp.]VVV01608.1 Macrolide export ATP-binding/permease protein MacB [Mesonia oceanica]|tara:strand:- start:49908 stop:52274 length:2367 start_codon:yes stop_codon:yes gene_type:complete
MFKNYIKIAWRNLLKDKFYNLISLLGLTIALTIAMFIIVWVKSELSYNSFINHENIFRISSNIQSGDGIQTWGVSTGPVATYAQNDIPEVKHAVRLRENYSYRTYSVGDHKFDIRGAYVDVDFFDMFQRKVIAGNRDMFLKDARSVVLTASTAEKLFGTTKAVGKTIKADFEDLFTVTGVVNDLPENSSVNYEMFFSLDIIRNTYVNNPYWKSMEADWGNFNFITYVELYDSQHHKKVNKKLTYIQQANDPNAELFKSDKAYYLQPINQMNLYSPGGIPQGINTVKIFSIVLFIILSIACINYVNLSTARASRRTKEVSIRKIIGAQKKSLLLQFITESVLFFSLAAILAIVLVYAFTPAFKEITAKDLNINFLDGSLSLIFLCVFLIIIIVSSIYPAFILTSFKPLLAIKGNMSGMSRGNLRKLLVTIQFVFSVMLIIGTMVISRQLEYITSKNPGYDRTQVLNFWMSNSMQNHAATVKERLKNIPGVSAVSFASNPIINNTNSTGDVAWDSSREKNEMVVTPMAIDEDFIPLMKMKLNAGENFKGISTDSTHYILNETAVKLTGIKNPIGKNFELYERKGTIIGVVEDFNFKSLKNDIGPMVMYYEPHTYRVYLKTSEENTAATITALENIWKEYTPDFEFNYSFLDASYEKMYLNDKRTGELFYIFTWIAIFVSCLGLFGLTTYTAQLKKREIGIRKVLGASVFQVTRLLSKEYLILILIAAVIAIPISWYLMQLWLQDFAYQTPLNWWIFISAGIITLFIALATVSFQAIKAGLANPVKNLRTD